MNTKTYKHNKKTDLCYIISHGFSARMLFQTGLISKLAKSGKTIAIVTPDPDDENLKEYADDNRITIYGSAEQTNIWDDDYHFKRKYFLEDIRGNTALWEKHIYSLFYSKSKHPWKRIRPLFYYLYYWLIKYFPSIRARFLKNEFKYLQSEEMADLIQKINPKLVISTYPVNLLEAKMLYAAKAQNISTLIHLLSWDNITAKGRFPMSADYFIVWGEVMHEELKAFYQVSEERIFRCGVPHFDDHIVAKNNPEFESILKELDLYPKKPYLFFAMSAQRFSPHEIDIVEWLAKSVENDVFGKEMQLIVRPHPQTVQGFMVDKSWLGRLKKLKSARVAVDYPRLVESKVRWSMQKNDMNYLSNILVGCSVCINSGSTVSIDALVVGKPVILTSFDGEKPLKYWTSARRLIDYTHLKKFINLGGAKPVFSYEEFKKVILGYLENPKLDGEKRQNALEKECFWNDGGATDRVVEVVREILRKI